MSEQVLRDRNGNYLGAIRDSGSDLVIYNAQGNYKGRYSPSNNSTYDANGNYVGSGNLLTTLL